MKSTSKNGASKFAACSINVSASSIDSAAAAGAGHASAGFAVSSALVSVPDVVVVPTSSAVATPPTAVPATRCTVVSKVTSNRQANQSLRAFGLVVPAKSTDGSATGCNANAALVQPSGPAAGSDDEENTMGLFDIVKNNREGKKKAIPALNPVVNERPFKYIRLRGDCTDQDRIFGKETFQYVDRYNGYDPRAQNDFFDSSDDEAVLLDADVYQDAMESLYLVNWRVDDKFVVQERQSAAQFLRYTTRPKQIWIKHTHVPNPKERARYSKSPAMRVDHTSIDTDDAVLQPPQAGAAIAADDAVLQPPQAGAAVETDDAQAGAAIATDDAVLQPPQPGAAIAADDAVLQPPQPGAAIAADVKTVVGAETVTICFERTLHNLLSDILAREI